MGATAGVFPERCHCCHLWGDTKLLPWLLIPLLTSLLPVHIPHRGKAQQGRGGSAFPQLLQGSHPWQHHVGSARPANIPLNVTTEPTQHLPAASRPLLLLSLPCFLTQAFCAGLIPEDISRGTGEVYILRQRSLRGAI